MPRRNRRKQHRQDFLSDIQVRRERAHRRRNRRRAVRNYRLEKARREGHLKVAA